MWNFRSHTVSVCIGLWCYRPMHEHHRPMHARTACIAPWHHRPMNALTAWDLRFQVCLGCTFTSNYFGLMDLLSLSLDIGDTKWGWQRQIHQQEAVRLGSRSGDGKQQVTVFEDWGHIFSRVWPFYEQAVSNLDRSMHRSLSCSQLIHRRVAHN
jgi:hypothetical protein